MNSKLTTVKVLSGLFLAILAAVSYWFLIRPGLETPAKLAEEQTAVEGQLATVQAQVAKLQSVQNDATKLKADIARSEKRFPSKIVNTEVTEYLTRLGNQTGVKVETISISELAPYTGPPTAGASAAPAPGEGQPGVLPPADVYYSEVTIPVDGSLPAIGRYADKLRTGTRAFAVTNLSSIPNEEGSYTATITASMYILPELSK